MYADAQEAGLAAANRRVIVVALGPDLSGPAPPALKIYYGSAQLTWESACRDLGLRSRT
jgi:hypothetical protein